MIGIEYHVERDIEKENRSVLLNLYNNLIFIPTNLYHSLFIWVVQGGFVRSGTKGAVPVSSVGQPPGLLTYQPLPSESKRHVIVSYFGQCEPTIHP